MSRVLWIVMLSVLLMNTGCEQQPAAPTAGKVTSDDVRRDAGKTIDSAVKLSQQTKEEFQKSLEARLKDVDTEIDALRAKGRDLVGEAKVTWEQKMAELEPKREAARAKLAELGDVSADAWESFRQGAQSAWADLDKSFHEAARELESLAQPN